MAITEPLKLGFSIDLHDKGGSNLIKDMKTGRPSKTPKIPQWSLNKVLNFLVQLPNAISTEMTLMKCSFLLMLATGWRVSELNACTRDPNYCKIINGKLWITPNPLFLAKNEAPDKRRPPKIIEPLLMEDGKPSCLCPVEAFKQYIKKSSKFKAGNLWIHPNSSQSLQVTQLGNLICKLIKKANPGLEATVHELRKFAASYALQGEWMQKN